MKQPVITDFLGDGFVLDKKDKQYLDNIEIWNYIDAINAYVYDLESKIEQAYIDGFCDDEYDFDVENYQ